MKDIVNYILESANDYKTYKNKLYRFGICPNGRNDEQWDFKLIDDNGAYYSISIYLDEDGDPFEFCLRSEGGNNDEDYEKSFDTYDSMIEAFKKLRKSNRK